VLLRFRRYALVKDSHLAVALWLVRTSPAVGNATAAEKRRAIYFMDRGV